ncbi:hypothetical protein FPV67DRAFT_506632 [Lyophyllum atratum]|nr:hypothetical protein FPV67DRAFT_506632 [Lyophyllum atratum]
MVSVSHELSLTLLDATSLRAPSSPTQKSGDITLPIELWLEILSYTGATSIRAITRTCSTLRWVAQPILFKLFIIRLHTSTPQSTNIRRDTHPTNSRARLAVLRHPHLASAMTEVRLIPSAPTLLDTPRGEGPRTPLTADSDLIDTIFTALPSLINLRRLVCHDVMFTKAHLSALTRLTQLKDLELQSCTVTCGPEDFPDFPCFR